MYAMSGLDIALWDIAGKAAGKPLADLLGGARRTDFMAYASLVRYGDVALIARNAKAASSAAIKRSSCTRSARRR